MRYSEEIVGLTRLSAAKSGDSQEGVQSKTLTLYAMAFDSKDKEDQLSVITPDDEIVQDIFGTFPLEAASLATS